MITQTFFWSAPAAEIWSVSDAVFFDIETTGFRASTSCLYMIGVAVFVREGWKITQWMIEKPSEEPGLLRVFAAFLRPYRVIVHFNGERFDIPYLSEKYDACQIENPLLSMRSIDLYKRYRPLKNLLGLTHMNQKSLESFLGIAREDCYDGGALIKVCREYWKTKEEDLLSLLILHNREDLGGMLSITVLDRYLPLACPDKLWSDLDQSCMDPFDELGGEFDPVPELSIRFTTNLTASGTDETDQLVIRIRLQYPIPVPIRKENRLCCMTAEKNLISLSVKVFRGKLRFYFDTPREYYYLPIEDRAIHKSVAVYVDPQFREKATVDTCYTTKEGVFLPQTQQEAFSPVYSAARKDPVRYFEFPEDPEDELFLKQYSVMLLKSLLQATKDKKST